VKKSIELLLSLELIRKDENGEYFLTNRTITTEPEVESVAVHSFHLQAGELAVAALRELPKQKRNFSGITVGISENMYKEICKDIDDFRCHILRKNENDSSARIAYQINIQFFPVSRDVELKGRGALIRKMLEGLHSNICAVYLLFRVTFLESLPDSHNLL
jgi:uncharacterized protein (TIGR02147 family)